MGKTIAELDQALSDEELKTLADEGRIERILPDEPGIEEMMDYDASRVGL